MVESSRERFARWGLEETLLAYPGLRVAPTSDGTLKLGGTLAFAAEPVGKERIDDEYEIEITVFPGFPAWVPSVRETAERIPASYHKLDDGSLCLGSPTRLHLILSTSPTVKGFVDRCVVPYLYGYSYVEKHGHPPFGELSHGELGIREDFASLYGVTNPRRVREFVRLTGMKKREANKQPCPCGRPLRLGRCHHRRVNHLRDRLGRRWFRDWYMVLSEEKVRGVGSSDTKPTGTSRRPRLTMGEKKMWDGAA
jgi:hypothetical protein